jgi:hypothetical protein
MAVVFEMDDKRIFPSAVLVELCLNKKQCMSWIHGRRDVPCRKLRGKPIQREIGLFLSALDDRQTKNGLNNVLQDKHAMLLSCVFSESVVQIGEQMHKHSKNSWV